VRHCWIFAKGAGQPLAANGFGVTARSADEALERLVRDWPRAGEIINLYAVEITDVAQLDQWHVVANMGSILREGGWFPNLQAPKASPLAPITPG
jgi:hypothetical protein